MNSQRDVIAPQKIMDVKNAMSSELSFAFDLIADGVRSNGSMRDRAEMREARKILYNLKHPDADMVISSDEMGWALRKMIEACEPFALAPAAHTMRNAARRLGLNVSSPRQVPRELDKKIGNALKVLAHQQAAMQPMAATA